MSTHMFTGASNFTISGGSFINQSHSQTSTLEKLSDAAAHSALHDAPARTDATRCYQNTRTNVLIQLEHWAQGICDEGASIFWLFGGAGAGKSAVMQTLVERCVEQGLALGSFFFFRSDPTRNTAEALVPTLAYQLAQMFPSVLQIIEPIILHDPLIFKKSLQVQLVGLLIRPLEYLVQLGTLSNNPQSPRVFLIDGLDECTGPAQQQAIIQSVATVCQKYRVPVKFLIASRPEHEISASFQMYKEENFVLGAISLSDDPNANVDIFRFFVAEFGRIRQHHPFKRMIPPKWPNIYAIFVLVHKSSSHFIYASTAIKYIWSVKESPVRSLQAVLGLEVPRSVSPFSELDALYHHIIGSAAHRDRVLQILAHCIFSTLPCLISIICIMLNCSQEDFSIFMADMGPLVTIIESPHYYPPEDELKLLHASLGDFLANPSRSGSLYIDPKAYLASKLERCFQLLDRCSYFRYPELDWPTFTNPEDLGEMPYTPLLNQVIITVENTGHLSQTRTVLTQLSVREFYGSLKRFESSYTDGCDAHSELLRFFVAVRSMETGDCSKLYTGILEDFFDILESDPQVGGTPLAPAVFPLLFIGYPANHVRQILLNQDSTSQPFRSPAFWLGKGVMQVTSAIESMGDLASIRHCTIYSSPRRLAIAGETILKYLIGGLKIHASSMPIHTVHQSWLWRTKPGKHVAMGSPRRASILHRKCIKILHRLQKPADSFVPFENYFQYSRGPRLIMVLWPKRGLSADQLRWQQEKVGMAVNLFNALLWILPKAGFSEEIMLYSRKTFPRYMYLRKPSLVRRVRKCLDDYTTRMRNAKLEELGQRIEGGDSNALIEKLRTFYIDNQD